MIAHALKPGTEVQKVWQLHEAYLFGMHPCHNLTVDCFHTFSGNEQLENIVVSTEDYVNFVDFTKKLLKKTSQKQSLRIITRSTHGVPL